MDEEKKAIMSVIDEYMRAIGTGKEEHFRAVFRPDSVVINASEQDESKVVTPIADFMERVKQRHEDGTKLEETAEKVTISVANDVANARVDFRLVVGEKTMFGTDFFNLVKRGGQWRISQKIYDVARSE
jgi:uncharacterized protein (TIGR02246 family)